MTMTDERLAELDAAYAKQMGTPFGENWIHLNTAAKHHIFAAYPDLRAMIDAQAATIAANTEREIHLTYVLKGLLGAYEAIVRQTGKDDLLRDDAPTWRNTARAALTGAA